LAELLLLLEDFWIIVVLVMDFSLIFTLVKIIKVLLFFGINRPK
jgi:hypothetical protein